jgi:RND family efflux transporter MFP subunit
MIRLIPALLILFACACDGDRRGRRGGGKNKWSRGGDKQVSDWRVLVEVTEATTGTVSRELVTHGSIESEAMADITPEAGGVVREILVEEGDSVARGQVLAVLSNPSLEAGSDRARVELAQAKRRFEQSETLHERGAISDTEFQEAQDAFSIAKASHREATSSAGFTRLTSPVDGTVAIRDVRLGELAGGAHRAFQVVDLARLRVIVNLSEGDLEFLSVGQPVVLAGTYDETAQTTGEVLRISPVVDQASGTVRVTIAVHNDDAAGPRLRPGQFVEVRIEIDRHEGVTTIPRRAVYWQDGAPIAWRVIDKPPEEEGEKGKKRYGDEESDEESDEGWMAKLFSDDEEVETEKADPWEGVPLRIAERVSLTVGYTDSNYAEISDGLSAGEQVVIVGGDNLRPDADVKLPSDPNPKKPEKDEKDGKRSWGGKPE